MFIPEETTLFMASPVQQSRLLNKGQKCSKDNDQINIFVSCELFAGMM